MLFEDSTFVPPVRNGFSHSGQLHPCHPAREAAFAHLLEHLSHLRILAEKIIDLLHGGSRTTGNSLTAAAVDHFVMQALVLSHRIDDRFDASDFLLVDIAGGLLQSGGGANDGKNAHSA